MAKTAGNDGFIKLATKMGLEQMLTDVKTLLGTDLTQAQRIANEEMRAQIEKHLEDLK